MKIRFVATATILSNRVLVKSGELLRDVVDLVRRDDDKVLLVIESVVAHAVHLSRQLVDDEVVVTIAEAKAHCVLSVDQSSHSLQ